MKKWLFLFLFLFSFLPQTTHASEAPVSLIVKSSSTSSYYSVLQIESDLLFSEILNAQQIQKVAEIPVSNHYIVVDINGIMVIYTIDDYGNVYDLQQKQKIHFSPKTVTKLKTYFNVLERKHFGQLADWEEVKNRIPKYSKFRITDLETGLSFHAQRRAGSRHADVQPLSRTDTKIMKEIFDGTWSWKRKAILVHVDNEVFAASMHGMPHGKGAIANGFPGHFCIHFKGSTVHKTKKQELSHQVMVYKAAGQLTSFVKQLSAEEIIELFFIACNQSDLDLLKLIYNDDVEKFRPIMKNIEQIKISKQHEPIKDGALEFELPIQFSIKEYGKKKIDASFTFQLFRVSPTSEWKIVNAPF